MSTLFHAGMPAANVPVDAPYTAWPRAIIHVDMNAFFAAIEQRDCPEWRGRPIAVTNGQQGTCIITCSYEARAFGINGYLTSIEEPRHPLCI